MGLDGLFFYIIVWLVSASIIALVKFSQNKDRNRTQEGPTFLIYLYQLIIVFLLVASIFLYPLPKQTYFFIIAPFAIIFLSFIFFYKKKSTLLLSLFVNGALLLLYYLMQPDWT